MLGIGASSAFPQQISGYTSQTTRPSQFLAAALGDSVIVKSGWYDVSNYKFFGAFVSISTDCTYWASTGLDTAQIVFSFEEFVGATAATASTKGYYEDGDTGRQTILTISAADTSNAQSGVLRLYKSFHGSGDPDIAPGQYIRFYYAIHDTLSNLTLDSFDFLKQP